MRGYLLLILLFSCYIREDRIKIEPNVDIEREFHNNGKLSYELIYKYGKLHGTSRTWNEEGNIISRIEYKNGILNGNWETYYKNGQHKNSIVYLNGMKNGLEVWYHQNGNKQSEVLYENDKIVSKILRWDEKGNQITN